MPRLAIKKCMPLARDLLANTPHGMHTIGRRSPNEIKRPFQPWDVSSMVAIKNRHAHVENAQNAPDIPPSNVGINRDFDPGSVSIVWV